MFDHFVQIIIELEGGDKLHSHPNDPGGLTKFGISQRAFPKIDIANLDYRQASAIYYHEYFLKNNLQKLFPSLSLCVFDGCVNQGSGASVRLLQRCLKIKEDGILGENTLKTINSIQDHDGLVMAYLTQRVLLYTKVGSFSVFGKGWINRVLRIHSASMLFKI